MNDIQCTCNEGDYYSQACPVHSQSPETQGYQQGSTTINDGYLVSESPINVQGFIFQCPVCKQTSIIANRSFIPNFCPACGIKFELQSAVLTRAVRENSI